MNLVKTENYINIQGWMVTNLNLKGNDLLIYAIIYGFTQDGQQWFEGSRQYLADWCNSTKRGISKNLDSLIEKGYIIKEEYIVNNVKFCKYKANLEKLTPGNKVHHPGEQSSPPPGEQSSPNNIDIYKLDNSKVSKKEKEEQTSEKNDTTPNNKKGKTFKRPSYDDLIEASFNGDVVLENDLKEFIVMRCKKNKAPTNEALLRLIDDLYTFGKNDKYLMREIVKKSILSCWERFFPLSNDEEQKIIEELHG